ncbi:MAG: hypothetical protein R6U29_01520 [Desulfosudaceae bacterium]
MTWWNFFLLHLDLVLIAPYRFFENPVTGFLFGTFILCLWCILLGELTYRIASRINDAHIRGFHKEMVKMHNLSIKALMLKDKDNFQACNKEANEAFGKYFFNMITLGAATLWPVPFALGWMHTRFGHIDFELPFWLPILGHSAGYAAVMIPMYILGRMMWAKLKPHLPILAQPPGGKFQDDDREEMIQLREVDEHGGIPDRFWSEGKLLTPKE